MKGLPLLIVVEGKVGKVQSRPGRAVHGSGRCGCACHLEGLVPMGKLMWPRPAPKG